MKKKLLSRLAAPVKIVKIIAKYEPSYLFWSLPQIIINSIIPLLYVYAPKLVIEKLTDGSAYSEIARVIIIYCGILLLLNILNKVMSNKSGLAADKFAKALRFEIGKITMRLELKDIEGASQREVIGMANNAAGLTGTMELVQSMVSNIITVTGLVYIIVRLDFVFLFAVAAVLTVKIIFTCLRYSYNKKMRILSAKNERIGNYLTGFAYFNQGGAKELRVNNLQDWFMGKIKGFRGEMVMLQYKDFRRYALFEIITATVAASQSFIVLYILSCMYIDSGISIADFTMYFTAVASLTAALSALTEQIGSYNGQVLNMGDYKKLIDLNIEENNGIVGKAVRFGLLSKIEIAFDNVSFKYPDTEHKVLENINIKITDKEKLVIVGLNGAGKTTFIKLLCKFYRPTAGRITLNGIDIWSIPNNEYYRIIAAVFQDYTNFAFSLAENITVSASGDTGKAAEIFGGLGMNNFIENLPDGLDTCLTKNFSQSGIELSGGEGQKLAIARAIYKNAPVLILDEPTASLDAKAESEIYEDFFNMSRNKTAIFISHRLAASTVADNIAVFADGKIAEYGSHGVLMKQNGLYAKMYRKQSKPYIDVESIL